MRELLKEWLIGRNNWIIDRMIERPIELAMERTTEWMIDLMTDRVLLRHTCTYLHVLMWTTNYAHSMPSVGHTEF